MDEFFQEEMQSEWNAQFDYTREAYAATALDLEHEGQCDDDPPIDEVMIFS